MPRRPYTTYQYKDGDDPITIAERHGLTPSQLLAANPGGTPFSVGQAIRVPDIKFDTTGWGQSIQQGFQYGGPLGGAFAAANVGAQFAGQLGQNTLTGAGYLRNQVSSGVNAVENAYRGLYQNVPNSAIPYIGAAAPGVALSILNSQQQGTSGGRHFPGIAGIPPTGYGPNTQALLDMRGRGYGQPDAVDQLNAMRGRGYGQSTTRPPQTGMWEDPAGTTPALGAGDFYGYRTNAETGRSERVVMNAANGDNFLGQLRWDPQRKKYVSLAKLIKQGKLDLKGNWRNSTNRQRQGAAQQRNRQQEERVQDYSLANSLITFSASSG